MRKILFYLFVFFIGFMLACNKDENISFDPSLRLKYSPEQVLFDQVFTSISSITKRFKVFNRNENAIMVTKIKLISGKESSFNININGQADNEIENLKINGNDSINVFVKVTINPNNQTNPFIVEDTILFEYNGNNEKIPLSAYGQNAIFLNNQVITNNATWKSRLPYVIYKDLIIASNATLSIAAGSTVLFHNNATLGVKGSLVVEGTKKDSVLFSSDRLERIYQDQAGQWNGIRFYGSSINSVINYGVIKNAKAGITVDSLSNNANPKLILANTIVKNMQVVGFLGYRASIAAYNNLFYNCGQYLFYAAGGGNYNLKQNTFAAYNYNFARHTPAVFISDYISPTEFWALNLNLTNNIIWGSLNDEFTVEQKSTANSSILAQHNLLKTKQTNYPVNNNILNTDPLFVSPKYGVFNLQKESPALNKGTSLVSDAYYSLYLKKDLHGKTRLFPSDLGCYENN